MGNRSFRDAVMQYLDGRAKEDELFAKSYAKENKNVDECCSYIMDEAKKRGNAVCMTDEEVFGMAVHYYDEDGLKVKKVAARCEVSDSGTMERKPENRPEMKPEKRPAKRKREGTDTQQLSLF